jgi:hypothetical protein
MSSPGQAIRHRSCGSHSAGITWSIGRTYPLDRIAVKRRDSPESLDARAQWKEQTMHEDRTKPEEHGTEDRDEFEDLDVSEQQAEDVRGGRGRKQPGVRGLDNP